MINSYVDWHNKEAVAEYHKRWRLEHPSYHKEWIKKHPDYYRNYKRPSRYKAVAEDKRKYPYKKMTAKQNLIITDYLTEKFSMPDLAKKYKVSHQAIHNTLKRADARKIIDLQLIIRNRKAKLGKSFFMKYDK